MNTVARAVVIATLGVLMALGLMAPASAAPVPVGTTTVLTAPSFVLRSPVALGAQVTSADGSVPSGVVRFEQQTTGGWAVIGESPVDAVGTARIQATFATSSVTLRATYVGSQTQAASESASVTASGVPQTAAVAIQSPKSVVDERPLKMLARVNTQTGATPDAVVSFQVDKDKKWQTFATARTDAAGVARATSMPRVPTRYRAVVTAADWYTGAKTAAVTVKNLPPGTVVKLPRKAPRPRQLAAQPRATGDGAQAKVSAISSSVWRSMTGRSWRAGCPVGRSQLRLVRVNYWGFDGYRHRGELVVHRSIAAKTARAFTDLYKNKVAIRAMYRVDRFGYSTRVRGGDDYESMASDNTSAFNCRQVIGRSGVRSPHATGRSIDINPFENPYRYRFGKWVPNTWWHTRSAGTYAWTKKSHLVPTIMRRNGFRWTYGNIDGQHFDG